MDRMKTTPEVADMLGITHKGLLTYLSRYPETRPSENITGAWFWTDEDIQRLIEFRAKKRRKSQSEKKT